ncbi:GAF domain-containing protein [bacterium]|nr:GAF domain-containing protein [bacterium]MCI0603301.1 GAF domain-containing protein [bacterium]
MPEETSSKVFQLYRIAYSLIFCRSLHEVLEVATRDLAKSVQAVNSILWQFDPSQGTLNPVCTHLTEKGIKTRSVSAGADYLGEVFRAGKPLLLQLETLRQPNKHMQLPKDMVPYSGICVPFKSKPELQGVLEMFNKTDPLLSFTEEEGEYLAKSLELVTVAASNMRSYEEQSRNQLNAITRLTLLYDISQIFNSTLELDQLLPIITEKIRDILDAETCTVWLLSEAEDEIRCAKSIGEYSELFSGYKAKLEEDIAGEVIKEGEGILLEDATEDERLKKRLPDEEQNPVVTYLAAPLECKGQILGTLEVMNRTTENLYNEEDQFLLNDLAHQAAVSIHNANLLRAERKAKELDALLSISHEITSTLNLDRVLKTIVNQSASLIPYDRAAIGLIDRGRVNLVAVSGRMEVDKQSLEMKDLNEIVTWAAHLQKGLYISEYEGKIITDREETREKFKVYFEKSGARSFVTLPLKDEEGELGILCFESAKPYFLDERHLEVVSILANQATVAIRNASLYKQVPLMNIMQPLLERKKKLLQIPRGRRIAWATGAALFLLLLIIVPWKMKVGGDVTVLPERRTPAVTEVEGIVQKVFPREGARVKKGTVVAQIKDDDYRLALNDYKMQREVLLKEISRSQSLGDSGTVRLKELALDQVNHEITYFENELKNTQIVAPVDGIIITPKIEEKVGSFLAKGQEFCELANMQAPRGEILVDEGEVGYLQMGQKTRLKMNSYPTMSFSGAVSLLGTQLIDKNPDRYYRLEARMEDPDALLRSGMAGKAKIEVGWRPIGYVFLRKPFRFLWKKLWVWFA